MIEYENTNLNINKKRTTDCVIRAITLAINGDYRQVAQDLFNIFMETGYTMSDKKNVEKYLKKLGFVKFKQPRFSNNQLCSIGELDELIQTECKTIIVTCNGHMSVIDNNILYDTWDCRKKKIGNYWVLKVDDFEDLTGYQD